MSEPLNLLFPVETIVRELDFRIVLAALHGRRDHRIFVGQAAALESVMQHAEGGLFVGKHIVPSQWNASRAAYDLAKRRGFVVVHLSEEGAVFAGDEHEWRSWLDYQLDPSILAAEDYVCTWGDYQRDYYLQSDPPCAANIRTTGHPRFDLCRRELRDYWASDADALRARFGRFVLVNTNFNYALAPEGIESTFSASAGYRPDDPAARHFFVVGWASTTRTVTHFVELIHNLADADPSLSIVLRPHPSDDLTFHRAVLAGLRNVHVLREGTVSPWLLASSVLVHDGCTTAIEAHLFDRRVINFGPEPSRESYLANLFGTRVTAPADAVPAVLAAARDASAPDVVAPSALPALARSLFVNLEGPTFPRFRAVLDEAEEAARRRSGAQPPAPLRIVADESRHRAVERAKDTVRPLFPARQRAVAHSRARFPGFDEADIRRRVARASALTGQELTLRRFYGPRLFELAATRR